MWYFFSVMKTDPTSVNNVVMFLVMETFYSSPLINVGSETSIQKKLLHTSVKNVVRFPVMEIEPNSVKNEVLFSFMETDYSTPLINVCSETSIQENVFPLQLIIWYLFSVMDTDPTSVKNVVIFISYGDILLNLFNYCMQ